MGKKFRRLEMSGLIERAKEELEMLESQHPDRFNYLKLDLKTFISDHSLLMDTSNTDISSPNTYICPSSLSQESSNRRKRKKNDAHLLIDQDHVVEASVQTLGFGGHECDDGSSFMMRRRICKTDAVLERAHQCLQQIQQFKNNF